MKGQKQIMPFEISSENFYTLVAILMFAVFGAFALFTVKTARETAESDRLSLLKIHQTQNKMDA